MAIQQNQMKISVLAKDFNIKSKDIVNILAAAGIERKTAGTIGQEEFSLFFDRLTVENQITNMSDYLAGKADIERPEVIEPKSVPAMEKEERGDLSEPSRQAKPAPGAQADSREKVSDSEKAPTEEPKATHENPQSATGIAKAERHEPQPHVSETEPQAGPSHSAPQPAQSQSRPAAQPTPFPTGDDVKKMKISSGGI